jgi:hypothetical protein
MRIRQASIAALGVVGLAALLFVLVPVRGQDRAPASSTITGSPEADRLRAFPGAEGEGMWATGGRGGDVYHVTTLNDDGPGSLRDGLSSADGPRTIVFDVGGVIELEKTLRISGPITVAGQTAPGQGICLVHFGVGLSGGHDIIVRHIRVRPGDARLGDFTEDALTVGGASTVIVDHCSTSWGVDENLSMASEYRGVTAQYCIIAEGLHRTSYYHGEIVADHPGHSMGSLIKPGSGDATASLHHNLWAMNGNRNPAVGSYTTDQHLWADVRNNVIYNCRQNGYSSGDSAAVYMNYVGNYIIAGPSTSESWQRRAFNARDENKLHIYQARNKIDGDLDAERNGANSGWEMFDGEWATEARPIRMEPVHTQSPDEAYRRVLRDAGAMPWSRDAVDRRIISHVTEGTGAVIDSQAQVGGYPELPEAHRPDGWDADADGMPDWWERRRGLDAKAADNNGDLDGDGYTNLEEYLHSMATAGGQREALAHQG